MNKSIIKIIGILMSLFLLSCKTYTLPIDSFKSQMSNATSQTQKEVKINHPPFMTHLTYLSNNVKTLNVINKDGEKLSLKISPTIEMKVTLNNGKKYNFLFDTVLLENDTLKGGRSRLIQNLTREIPIDSIAKIQLRNSGKKIYYQN